MCYNRYVQFHIITDEREGAAESDAILMQEKQCKCMMENI